MISKEKSDEFAALYRECLETYTTTPAGKKHIAHYRNGREQAEINFANITRMKQRGEDITDAVLLKLLPHTDTAPNRKRGAWVHVAPAITKDIHSWFEGIRWTKAEDWPQVAGAIFEFVSQCVDEPSQLEAAVERFLNLPYIKGFQTGMLTPVLSALKPDDFVLINSKPLKVINYLTDKQFGASLRGYPQLNLAAKALIDELSPFLTAPEAPDLHPGDLFDMFSHWMVAVRKYDFSRGTSSKSGIGRREKQARSTSLSGDLGPPFNQIFESYDQADRALELIAWAAERLGARGRDDPLEAFTYRRYRGKHAIHYSFGRWLILGFAGREGVLHEMHIALLTGSVDVEPLEQGTFATEGDEPSITLYSFSADDFFPLDEDAKAIFEETLAFAQRKFDGWVRSPYSRHSMDRLADAILNPENRERVLSEGLPRTAPKSEHREEDFEGLEKQEAYPLARCAGETGLEESLLGSWVRAIHRKGQAILYGPPGTGKTYVAERLAKHLVSGGDGFIELVQFHPAYTYEDFIQGIRPKPDEDGTLRYPLISGRFLEFCEIASSRSDICVLIIDEINRANLSHVFGELMYLLEYRAAEVPLAGGGSFSLPDNVRIVGTMNTADRSIALVDHALRRRFAFLALYPRYEILKLYHQRENTGFAVDAVIRVLERLNRQIHDPNYAVGITYFLRRDIKEHLADVWRMEIEPYLEEYFFDRRERVDEFRWERIAIEVGSG